jgi:glycosyltransferase involved in cell wall biosynthesis
VISIIVPLYDEEGSLEPLFEKLQTVAGSIPDKVQFVFVNDGSRDASPAILDHLALRDDRVVVVHLRRNFGQTAALMAGFDHADGEVIVSIDADLQNDPGDIPRLLEKLDEGFDVVSGWRKDRQDPWLTRVLPSRLANRLISLISRVPIHDYGCTLKAYRAPVLENVRLYGEMHRFIPIYARWQGARIAELEVQHYPRRHGKSKYGMSRVFKVIMDLLVVKFLHEYNQKPMYVFGGAGVFSFLIAFLAGGFALFYKFTGQKDLIETPLPLLVALALITGVMCFLMGLLAEMMVRTYFEAQEKRTYVVERITGART